MHFGLSNCILPSKVMLNGFDQTKLKMHMVNLTNGHETSQRCTLHCQYTVAELLHGSAFLLQDVILPVLKSGVDFSNKIVIIICARWCGHTNPRGIIRFEESLYSFIPLKSGRKRRDGKNNTCEVLVALLINQCGTEHTYILSVNWMHDAGYDQCMQLLSLKVKKYWTCSRMGVCKGLQYKGVLHYCHTYPKAFNSISDLSELPAAEWDQTTHLCNVPECAKDWICNRSYRNLLTRVTNSKIWLLPPVHLILNTYG